MFGRSTILVAEGFQPVLRQVGLDADAVFEHPDIRVWRSIPERENATLDAVLADGRTIRLHVKRYKRGAGTPAEDEAQGIQLLRRHGIPTVPLVAWGRVADGRSFVITEDLAGFDPADKLIERGLAFDTVRDAAADLAAKLHSSGLHHRDLYLCHFFAKVGADCADLRLIDAARVKRLPHWPLRQRWIVKDLAQFCYSTLSLPVTDEQRDAWLTRYATQRGLSDLTRWRRAIERKVRWIARHDVKLRRAQPDRNISIPRGASGEP